MVAANYAFGSWIGTIIVYIIFLFWAFAPASVLHSIGVTYYPNRYYSIALPAYIFVSGILGGIAYVGLNMWNTLDPDDLSTVEDADSIYIPKDFERLQNSKEVATPDVGDMDICDVSVLLHGSEYSHES